MWDDIKDDNGTINGLTGIETHRDAERVYNNFVLQVYGDYLDNPQVTRPAEHRMLVNMANNLEIGYPPHHRGLTPKENKNDENDMVNKNDENDMVK